MGNHQPEHSTSSCTNNGHVFARACKVIPGGVNSPVRAFRSVGCAPIMARRGSGSHLWDLDGKEFIDYICSWGPLIFGHSPSFVREAVQAALAHGSTFGLATEHEVVLAELLTKLLPHVEKVRLVSSGTEAVMTAIRLSRAFTGKKLVLKFEGGYHGHSDGLLAGAGSGLATLGIPSSPGVPEEYASLTLTIPFNDLGALRQVVAARGQEIACLIAEPIPANMGVIIPHGHLENHNNINIIADSNKNSEQKYWQSAQSILKEAGILLVFDEVITGFRLGINGGSGWTGVVPDLATYGKIIGGGLPLAAFGGRREIMSMLAPEGKVYQAGTLSGNPLAVAAGTATINELVTTQPYEALATKTTWLKNNLTEAAQKEGVPVTINAVGSLLTIFFRKTHTPLQSSPVFDFTSAATSDTAKYATFFAHCLAGGILLPPSQFEALFISTAHSDDDLSQTLTVMKKALAATRKSGT